MKHVKMTKAMTIDEIRTSSDKAGFVPVTYTRGEEKFIKTVSCKKCKDGKMLAFRSKEKGTKYHTAHACTCGYREFFGYGVDKKKTSDAPTKEVKTCRRKGCNNPVPEGRKAECYSCRPKPHGVVM